MKCIPHFTAGVASVAARITQTLTPLVRGSGESFAGLRAVFAVGLSVVAVSGLAQAEDWPQWRGINHNGTSNEKGWQTTWPNEGPKVLWKSSVGTGFSSVSVAEGRAFTLGHAASNDTIFCFDASTGKELWKQSYPCALDDNYYEGGPASTPTIDGKFVYSISKRGLLLCLEAATGKIAWERDVVEGLGATKPEWGFAGSPLVDGDRLILNVGGAGAALSKWDGKLLWSSGTNVPGYATPVPFGPGDERATVIFSSTGLVAVRNSDGHQLWSHPWVEEYKINAADPILPSPDNVFLSSYTKGCARLKFDESGVTEIWTNKNLAVGFSSSVLVNGHIFGIHGTADGPEKEVRCIDAATGELKWKREKFGLGSLIAVDGQLLILSEKGELFLTEASPVGFKVKAQAQVLNGKCWTPPTFANGRIYCRNAKGSVVCLDVRGTQSDPSAIPVNARESKP